MLQQCNTINVSSTYLLAKCIIYLWNYTPVERQRYMTILSMTIFRFLHFNPLFVHIKVYLQRGNVVLNDVIAPREGL